MKLSDFQEIKEHVSLDDYLFLYTYVRDHMEHPEWLGTFTKEEIEEILCVGGKIWLYYDKDLPVCSVFYIPTSDSSLQKHHVLSSSSITGSLGPIMVHSDNIYSIRNILKDGYQVIDTYQNERGPMTAFFK